jgi:hypothetical protein
MALFFSGSTVQLGFSFQLPVVDHPVADRSDPFEFIIIDVVDAQADNAYHLPFLQRQAPEAVVPIPDHLEDGGDFHGQLIAVPDEGRGVNIKELEGLVLSLAAHAGFRGKDCNR